MIQLTCADLVVHLSDYIDGHLTDDLIAAAQDHLATCHNCSVVLSSTQKMILIYRLEQTTPAIPPDRKTALLANLLTKLTPDVTPNT